MENGNKAWVVINVCDGMIRYNPRMFKTQQEAFEEVKDWYQRIYAIDIDFGPLYAYCHDGYAKITDQYGFSETCRAYEVTLP